MTINDVLQKELKHHISKIKTMENGHLHKMIMNLVEKSLIQLVIKETNGNQSDASRILGINRNTLRKKMLNYKVKPAKN